MGQDEERQAIDRSIEENLRRVYQDLLKEEVPQRFKDLLEELRAKTEQPRDEKA